MVADAIIWSTGNRKPHTRFLPDALLDDEGFVKTKDTLEVVGSDCLFAIGDVASTDPRDHLLEIGPTVFW